MNRSRWRAYAAYWRDLTVATLAGETRESSAHPPDLCRSIALYERFLR